MSQATQGLEIPKTLLDPGKIFSEELAAKELSTHAAAYDQAYLLYGAFRQAAQEQRRVPLPGTQQEVYLDKNKTRDGGRGFLHLFGVVGPEDRKPTTKGIHLVTFSQVQQVAGVHYIKNVPGVTLDKSISDSRQVALSSSTQEFQFVVNALEVMHGAAAELGLLATREAQPA